MPKKQSKRGLGKGLGALIPAAAEEFILDKSGEKEEKSKEEKIANEREYTCVLSLEKISTGKEQPRKVFVEDKIKELADSISRHGVLQPLVVRKGARGKYDLIAGERRLRGAKLAGLKEVPVTIIEADDHKMAELSLIENLQREDLAPLEEALAFRRMLDEYRYTQEVLSEALGKSRSYIGNSLRLLTLSPAETAALEREEITPGHARALLSVKEADGRSFLLEEILRKNLSVRQAEELSKRVNAVAAETQPRANRHRQEIVSPYYKEMENKLRQRFGTKVKIKSTPYGGCIEIDYYNEEDLNRILNLVVEEEKSLVE